MAPDLNAWLTAHPNVAGAIKWQPHFQDSGYDVPETAKVKWSDWTAAMRNDLVAAFSDAWTWLEGPDPFHALAETIQYPPTNVGEKVAVDTATPAVKVDEGWAWDLYVRWVAWHLVVESEGWSPWSVTGYGDEALQVLFDSAAIMARAAGDQMVLGSENYSSAYFVKRKDNLGASLIAPPRYTAAFLELNGLRGPTRLTTIANLLQWAGTNLVHSFGGDSYGDMEAYWQYRGLPPITRIVEGTTSSAVNEFEHWTSGCHGTAGFLRNVLRAVNIPVQIMRINGHAIAYFMTEGRYLDHCDDPYNVDFKATGLPASELLITEATFASLFGTNPDNHDDPALDACVGRQVEVLKQRPADLFVRDNVDDLGDEPLLGGGLSMSPDVHHFRQQLQDAATALGSPSVADRTDLFEPITFGQDNFVYVRLRNRGNAAGDASIDVYWAYPTTLPSPGTWTKIGTLAAAAVEPGEIRVVGPLTWAAGAIPAAGHSCFVAVVDAGAADPKPDLAAVQTLDAFYDLVREKNNVTWKNFDVEDVMPGRSHRMDFRVRGWPGARILSDLELDLTRLPRGAEVALEIATRLVVGAQHAGLKHVDERQHHVTLSASASKRAVLRAMPLRAGDEVEATLRVTLPAGTPAGEYLIAVSQRVGRREIGRVSRLLVVR